MENNYSEVKLFQVKPDKSADFEALIKIISEAQRQQLGCIGIKYMKRFYTIDGVERGSPPRKMTKIVKCIKYFSYWEFDNIENYGKANGWFFDNYEKPLVKLLIAPFDINGGYLVEDSK